MSKTQTANNLLLHLKEHLSENLSSEQIEKTLDQLIFHCLEPVVHNTHYLDYLFIELIPHIFLNMRRKFSNKPYPELRDSLFSFIMLPDPKEKLKILKKLRLERSVYFHALVALEKASNEYLQHEQIQLKALIGKTTPDFVQTKQIAEEFGCFGNFGELARQVTFWLPEAFKFRAMIVEKFTRLAYVEAKRTVEGTGLKIDVDDLFRDLVLATFKAVDKYDSQKGALASYVGLWFMEAKTNYRNSHEYGVAYQMPTTQRKKMLTENTAYSLTTELNDQIAENLEDETQNTLQAMIDKEDTVLINNLSCRVDHLKLYALTNDLVYRLTDADREIQRNSLKTA